MISMYSLVRPAACRSDAVPAFDHLRPRWTRGRSRNRPPDRCMQRHRGHRRAGRRARLHLHDRRAGLDRLVRARTQATGDNSVGALRLARPAPTRSPAVPPPALVHAELRGRAVDAHGDAKLHRAFPFYRTFAITSSRKRRMLSIVASSVGGEQPDIHRAAPPDPATPGYRRHNPRRRR